MNDKHRVYFETKRGELPAPVDDATATDLNLDQVFEFLDSTRSTPGQAVFYAWLRDQCATLEALEERRTLVTFFRENEGPRRRAEKALHQLGKQNQGNLVDFLWKDTGNHYVAKAAGFQVLAVAELLVFLASLTLGMTSLVVLLVLSLVNLVVYSRTTKYIGNYTNSIAYLAKMLMMAKKVDRIVGTGATEDHAALRKAAKLSTQIPFTIALFLPSANLAGDLASAFFEYYRIFLLGEIRAYFSFQKALGKHQEAIKKSFELVGKIDASLCLLDIEDSDLPTTVPEFTSRLHLKVIDLVHPLIPDFVPLSLSLEKGAVVTGTNMAGKSTFLRTLGINQVLATTLNIALAKEYHSCFARVLTALEISDDLLAGKSRYLAQAERILKVISVCEQEPALALIDEILSGTNSQDRILASVAILRHLATTKSLVVASTHDLEIAQAVSDLYRGLYFSEILDDNGVEFDYKIHQGIVDRSNAFRILAHLGFSKYLFEDEKRGG